MTTTARHFYEFGSFRLDVTERVLTRDGQPVALTLKAFDTLLLLVENNGHIVTNRTIAEYHLARQLRQRRRIERRSALGNCAIAGVATTRISSAAGHRHHSRGARRT